MTEQQESLVMTRDPEVLVARVAELENSLTQAGQDLIAFKANVRKEAMIMAQRHDLCAVVEQTLEKVGIGNQFKRVKITTVTESVRIIDVPEDLLNGYTPEQITEAAKTYITGRMNSTQSREWNQVRLLSGPRNQPNPEIRVEVVERTAAAAGRPEVPGYGRYFIGIEGRVTHFVSTQSQPPRQVPALCGKRPEYTQWQTTSSRDEGRDCAACTTAAITQGRIS